MNIPLTNLTRQYQTIKIDVNAAMSRVCQQGDYILGDEVALFEQEYANYIGTNYCVGVANGTDAIRLILKALKLGPGDEVIVQANTFIASVLPIIELGATPILVDVDEESGAIDINRVAQAITKRTRVILPVHLFGLPAPMSNLVRSTEDRVRSIIIEDAAQAQGSSINGKKCGSFGVAAATSFYPGKNLGAFGDAGAITTNSKKLYDEIRILRNVGQKKKYLHTRLGTNSRLDTIQAAILRIKLKHLDDWNKKRQSVASYYLRNLSDLSDLSLPPEPPDGIITNYHQFVIRTNHRDKLAAFLLKHGIHTGIHYPIPLHLTPALKYLGYKKGDFPVAEIRAQTMLSLPMFPELTESEISYIIEKIRAFYS